MDLIQSRSFPKNVNLIEVRAYMYACFLENEITLQQWNEFENGVYGIEPALLLV